MGDCPSLRMIFGLQCLQATRWDNYLHIFDPRIHWFSLINSLIIVVFLCIMVSMILLRSVSRDVRLEPLLHCATELNLDFALQCY